MPESASGATTILLRLLSTAAALSSLVIPRPSLDPASRSLGEFLSLSVARLARWRQPVMDWNHGNFESSVALAPYCL